MIQAVELAALEVRESEQMALHRKSKLFYLIKNFTHDCGVMLFQYVRMGSLYTQKEIYELSKEFVDWYEERNLDEEWNELFSEEDN